MSAEAEFTEGSPVRPGLRCKFCARILIPEGSKTALPDECARHCETKGCNWCGECYRGETTVSPKYKPKDDAA